ncbi:two-component system, LytTR family, sensor histidine kinase AgrC [Enterococcus sp. DIV1286c]|uniref:GHKL domain-containing protein n=1 Tax=Enterococcus sp. DIV1286c TaxID=2774800 RepID=UPI003F21552C
MNLDTLESLLIVIVQTACIFWVTSYLETHLKNRYYVILSIIGIICYMALYFLMNFFATAVLWASLCAVTYYFRRNIYIALFIPSVTFCLYIFSDYIINFSYTILHLVLNIRLTVILGTLLFFFFAYIFKTWLLEKCYKDLLTMKISGIIATATICVYFCLVVIERFPNLRIYLIDAHELFMILYGLLSAIICFSFIFIKRTEYENREQKRQMSYLIEYSEQAEKNYLEILKFKHDYKNILISLEEYIETEDLTGLKDYFRNSIKATGSIFDQEIFRMSSISNIKIREIKSVIMSKLYMAHQKGIHVSISVPEVVNHVEVSTMVLVRMLGIILDNAIEASEEIEHPEIEHPEIELAIVADHKDCTFMLINNCPHDLPKLHDLKKASFTTKPGNSGIGLTNLDELVQLNAYVFLDTKIQDEKFIQIITICEVEG